MTTDRYSGDLVGHAPPVATLVDLVANAGLCQLLAAAVEFRIADHMMGGAMRPEQLSALIAADTGCTRRALRALSTIGFCRETGDGAFELEDLGAFLSASQTSSLRDWLTWFTRHQWGLWPKLSESIRSGTSARHQSSRRGRARCCSVNR